MIIFFNSVNFAGIRNEREMNGSNMRSNSSRNWKRWSIPKFHYRFQLEANERSVWSLLEIIAEHFRPGALGFWHENSRYLLYRSVWEKGIDESVFIRSAPKSIPSQIFKIEKWGKQVHETTISFFREAWPCAGIFSQIDIGYLPFCWKFPCCFLWNNRMDTSSKQKGQPRLSELPWMKGGYYDENSFSVRNEGFRPSLNTETECSKRFQIFLKWSGPQKPFIGTEAGALGRQLFYPQETQWPHRGHFNSVPFSCNPQYAQNGSSICQHPKKFRGCERQLGIDCGELDGVDGYMAVRLT